MRLISLMPEYRHTSLPISHQIHEMSLGFIYPFGSAVHLLNPAALIKGIDSTSYYNSPRQRYPAGCAVTASSGSSSWHPSSSSRLGFWRQAARPSCAPLMILQKDQKERRSDPVCLALWSRWRWILVLAPMVCSCSERCYCSDPRLELWLTRKWLRSWTCSYVYVHECRCTACTWSHGEINSA